MDRRLPESGPSITLDGEGFHFDRAKPALRSLSSFEIPINAGSIFTKPIRENKGFPTKTGNSRGLLLTFNNQARLPFGR